MFEPYLAKLTRQLAEGVDRLPHEMRERQIAFLKAQQNEDGGFSGREGGSDVYYSAFALRSLAVLDALSDDIRNKAAVFLRSALQSQVGVVDFFSLLYACFLLQLAGGPDALSEAPSDWPDRVSETFEKFRTSDGGYGKAPNAKSGSTYHTFLVGLCYELLGRTYPEPDSVSDFIISRQAEDGGFLESPPRRRSGTNPTAAGVGILQLIHGDDMPSQQIEPVIDFLANMQSSEEGGLKANDRIPVADLLSTFTGLWTLQQLNALDRIDADEARDYAQSLELPDGGFRLGIWDNDTDVEYTFYGIGTLALFAPSD